MLAKVLLKVEKVSAWILFFVIIAYAVTGYGMIRGLIDSDVAYSLHLSYLGIIGLIAFVIHTAWSISMAFKRWRIWNTITKILLVIFYVGLISFFIYVHFFYQTNQGHKISETLNSQDNLVVGTTVFTAGTLSKYDGLNGNPAYIAVDGIVYDVSDVFVNGQHRGWKAGQDLTDEFYKEHSQDLLARYAVMGTYQSK